MTKMHQGKQNKKTSIVLSTIKIHGF